MSHVYLGFSADLRDLLERRMRPLAREYKDDWQAAVALMPGLEQRFRDQLAVEHLVRCYRLAFKEEADALTGTRANRGPKPGVPNSVTVMLKDIGATSGQVKAWAVHQGLLIEIRRGQVSRDLVELYALAHQEVS